MTKRSTDQPPAREYAIEDTPPPWYARRIDGASLLRGGQPQRGQDEDARRRSGTFSMLLRTIGFQTR